MSKKDFTKAASNAADIFFSGQTPDKDTHVTNDEIVTQHTQHINHTNDIIITNNTKQSKYTKHAKHTHVTNKSKHYDDRGKRGERYGLLMDSQLKDDLKNLANAVGSPSVNDLIVTILLEYVEAPERQKILKAYRNLQKITASS